MISGPSIFAGEQVDISGYWKTYLQIINPPSVQLGHISYGKSIEQILINRLRLKLYTELTSTAALTVAYDLSPRYSYNPYSADPQFGFSGGIGTEIYRAIDFDAELWYEDNYKLSLYHNLDRLFLSLALPQADIYLGRQAIAWGSARVINPTDILAPFAYGELDVEDRVGVDAVRVRIPLGFMGEIDGGWVFGEDFDAKNNSWFLRGKYFVQRTDVTGIVSGFRGNLMLGFDLTRALGGAGSWFEAAYVINENDSLPNESNYWRLSLGVDYSLVDGTYLFAEYHYNEAGTSEPGDYLDLTATTPYREGAVYLLGRHYLVPGVIHPITPLLSLNLQSIINLDPDDPSAYFTMQLEYSISNNSYLAGGLYKSAGKGPSGQLWPPFHSPGLRSEFGSYADLIFFSFRTYF
jgi:hypothetical protein